MFLHNRAKVQVKFALQTQAAAKITRLWEFLIAPKVGDLFEAAANIFQEEVVKAKMARSAHGQARKGGVDELMGPDSFEVDDEVELQAVPGGGRLQCSGGPGQLCVIRRDLYGSCL